uniref:Coiled-coil domain-containing protein 28A n=1 Tax=Lepeophtheirus salmonis TaxID=72036 RepID=C1BSW6_LEPSM|nr:Coiled-coil domain-containing protein 28A [Lepeophtheirus salmonis]ACO12650.1 Coiled-coil domain-containing protein 28A [Lepeophtheirus salmonis]
MAKPDTSTENTFCHTHSFHTDPVEVKHMEKSLLRLLHDFNSCKSRLRGYSLDQMEHIRNQQESLARLHFELASKGECFSPLSENGIRVANENMDKLMSRLETLSEYIEDLNPRNQSLWV